jgi:uncharacterized protein
VSVLYTLLGLNRAGKILYMALFVLAVPALAGWFVVLPRLRFHDDDERLFRAARHGDIAGVERSLAAGGRLNVTAPVDGKTVLFRAAVFGHADLVRMLLKRGADSQARGSDGRTALEVVLDARGAEKDRDRARALDAVAAALREAGAQP